MISEKTYTAVLEWLEPVVKAAYDGSEIVRYAGGHTPLKGIISSLWSFFDDAISQDKLHRIKYGSKSLYVFNGEYYERVGKEFLEEVALRVLTSLGVSTAYRLTAPYQIAQQCLKRIACSDVYEFRADRRYIVFSNGVFDVKDGKLKPFDARYCTDLVLDFKYYTQKELDIEAAKGGGHSWQSNYAKLWLQKLDEVIPNKELQADFQQFCGSLLIKREDLKTEYVCLLTSNGANGKSTISSAVANVFGEEYVSTFSPQEIFSGGSNSQFVINELDGKLLNICDDLDYSKKMEGGRMKGFVSGEKLTGRGLYSPDFKKVRPPMMLVCANDLPYTTDDSWGHHRRQMVIKCTNVLPKQVDRELGTKLATDIARAQIFLWIYEGTKRVMRQRGIELSADCRDAILNQRDNSSPMRIWATEMRFVKAVAIDNKDPRWYKLTDLYAMYRAYCAEGGYKAEADARKVSAMLVSLGCEKKNLNGNGVQLCVGRLGVDTNDKGQLINGK